MTPRTLVTAIAFVFAGCVVTIVPAWLALTFDGLMEREWSSRLVRLGVCAIFAGGAVRMGVRLVRGCVVERWFAILVCAALAVGVFVNAEGHPAPGLAFAAAAFALCATGLLTPFAGHHFAAPTLKKSDPS